MKGTPAAMELQRWSALASMFDTVAGEGSASDVGVAAQQLTGERVASASQGGEGQRERRHRGGGSFKVCVVLCCVEMESSM